MPDETAKLRERLLILLRQVEQDRAATAGGAAVYSKLFDSLTATLHNLDRSSADEKRVD